MAVKKYDAAVKVRTYKDASGADKAVWKNIGAVFQNDKGHYLVMDRTFNPAGVPNPDNKDSIMVSLFTPDAKDAAPSGQGKPRAAAPLAVDDVPF